MDSRSRSESLSDAMTGVVWEGRDGPLKDGQMPFLKFDLMSG